MTQQNDLSKEETHVFSNMLPNNSIFRSRHNSRFNAHKLIVNLTPQLIESMKAQDAKFCRNNAERLNYLCSPK